MIEYRLDLKTRAGVLVAQVTDFYELSYTKRVNEPGLLTVLLEGTHPDIPLLEHCSQVEVWRRDSAQGIDWYCDFYGLYMQQRREFNGVDDFVMTCPGVMTMLSWRHVLYRANVNHRSTFSYVPAETVMKNIVTYNCTASASVSDGRIRNGQITGLQVEADLGRGKRIDLGCSWKNVLDALQNDVAPVAGGDFDLVPVGAAAWEFRFYPGQKGTDRSIVGQPGSVVFSLGNANMDNALYEYNRIDEKTVIIVGGQGQEDARLVEVVYGPDYVPGTNEIEYFSDGRNFSTTDGLNAYGSSVAQDKRASQTLTFDVLQASNTLYGKHYFVGDLVRASYGPFDGVRKIVSASVDFKSTGEESIKIEISTP